MGRYSRLASDIIENVGGKENIKSLTHCVTRLRFNLLDESKANDKALQNLKGVVSVVKSMGQYMVVIGDEVIEVYDEVLNQLGTLKKPGSADKEKKGILDRALLVIGAAMGPTLNILCACGVIKGVTSLLLVFGLTADSGIYMLLTAAGDCIFYFLPMILAYNIAQKFDIDPFFGLVFASALIYPTIQGVDISILGYTMKATYSSSFMPVFFGMLLVAPVYKMFDRIMPKAIKGFMVPLLTLLITFPITFVLIGPFANVVGNGLNYALNFIFNFSPIIGGMLLGGLWQIMVMFGVHGVIVTMAFYALIAGTPSPIMAMKLGASYAVCGTLLAIAYKTKKSELKSQSGSACLTAFLGITEPAMYGIIIPRKAMLFATCIGGAVGGLITGIFKIVVYVYTGMGPMALIGFFNPNGNTQVLGIVLCIVLSFVTSFVISCLLYKEEKSNDITLAIPTDGTIKPLKDSTDSVFSSCTLGKGCLIIPSDNSVYAPVSGVVTTLFPTKHAIGITSDDGVEVLIHIGINTVNLNGEGFETYIKQGDTVKQNQLLVKFDKAKIEENGFSTEIPVIVTNTKNYVDVIEADFKHHKHGETMMSVVRQSNE